MKIGRLLFGVVLLAFLMVASTPLFGAQGDLLTLSLGDSHAVANQKLAAYVKAKEANILSPDLFRTKYLDRNVECSLGFFQEKLYDIWIMFDQISEEEYDDQFKKMILEEIDPALVGIYHAPTTDYGLPEQDEIGEYLLPVMEWDLDGKTILSGVIKTDGKYRGAIEIYDNALMAMEEEEKQNNKAEDGD